MKIAKLCPICEVVFFVKPSHDWRVYCNKDCVSVSQNKHELKPCPDCGVLRSLARCQKPTRCPGCLARHISERHKRTGNNPRAHATPESEAKRLAALRTDSHREALRAVHLGVPKTSPLQARHSPVHTRAVDAYFRSPVGIVYHVRNITRFVHLRPEVFAPDDVVWAEIKPKSYRCKASYGLASLCRRRSTRLTWKGWTRVSEPEVPTDFVPAD